MVDPQPARLGRFELLGQIARGGMAVILLGAAEDHSERRLVALKRLRPELREEPRHLAMFLEEARIGLRMAHPNVARTLELWTDGADPVVVQEYLRGWNCAELLHATVRSGRPLELGAALTIVQSVCAGLHHAHELRDEHGQSLNVVHRDVKPRNVMLLLDGAVKLIDFGIAIAEDRAVRTTFGVAKGTPGYMAPEQVRCEPVDRRTDVFAAGALAFELLTGNAAFTGATEWDVLQAVLTGPIPELPESVPDPIRAVVRRALSREPEARFESAEAFAAALVEAAEVVGAELGTATVRAELTRSFAGELPREPARLALPRAPEVGANATTSESTPTRAERPHRRSVPRALVFAGALVVIGAVGGALALRTTRSLGAANAEALGPAGEPGNAAHAPGPSATVAASTSTATPSAPATSPASALPSSTASDDARSASRRDERRGAAVRTTPRAGQAAAARKAATPSAPTRAPCDDCLLPR